MHAAVALGVASVLLRTVIRARRARRALSTTNVKSSRLSGGCLCGGIQFSYGGEIAQILICHCGMCRRAIGAAGVPFAALPRKRLIYTHRATLREYRSSSFATRSFCGRCGCSMKISYDCEEHTDWVNIAALDWHNGKFDTEKASHIHWDGRAAYETWSHLPTFDGFDSWVVDVCRPEGCPEPCVCDTCFQLTSGCKC